MSVLYMTEQGSYLRKQAGRFVVTRKEDELASVPETALDRVLIFGHCQVSSQAVQDLLDRGVDLVYLSRGGQFKGMLSSACSKNVFIRLTQYECSLNDPFTLESARNIVSAKMASAAEAMRSWRRNGWTDASAPSSAHIAARRALVNCSSHAELRAQEAAAAREYFAYFSTALPPMFEWEGRNRRPPRDPVNALLSLTYMLTLGHVIGECYARGLDPHIGFLHQLDYGRPSLALDLLEPLRSAFCDRFVLSNLQAERFEPDEFTYSSEQGCRLGKEGFRRFIERFEAFRNNGSTRSSSLRTAVRQLVSTTVSALRNSEPLTFVADN